jgi:hypothetical protein
MASGCWKFYPRGLYHMAKGDLDLDSTCWKIMIANGTYAPAAAHDCYGSASGPSCYQAPCTHCYATGGKGVGALVACVCGTALVVKIASCTCWKCTTMTSMEHAVLYKNAAPKYLLAYLSFDALVSTSTGTLKLDPACTAGQILKITT